ncbi:proline--tRNA ligase [Flavilitoribacter nigricans]|uniref:Proline--tRNA ligase n=1 Tax=Flavilitoribacter nigricans (strain ATCC 23147 / DSM 23189 / NBRC 102662 / NCIMB 1420 / SS-2) TaxID=1122177 RepID=A0A2D0N508_FLAN2|nr:proline--tRNA ligase [Flavilitoribacter nigricans]PHN03584.1 proline--tRNA ligase [Flavilitoribacter nigricans DSM 23189 = NBRC 102662]
MRFTHLFSKTLREEQKDADAVSHNLLLRAGYVRQLAAGIFSYLHFGLRTMRKIEQILREEMDRIGGDEISMPVVHPAELWQKTNRWYDIDESLVRFKDRGDRDMVLAMTHEEVVATLASREIDSYKHLPKLVYQIQTKFRDEARARGGLIRVREFTMKDSYSLDTDMGGLQKQYDAHYHAYFKIFERIGLPAIAILSDTGMMGGQVAHEYMYVTPIGEDTIFICEESGYMANKEVATIRKVYEDKAPLPLEKVFTPQKKTIADLADFLGKEARETGKVVFYKGQVGEDEKVIMALVRGDMEVNPIKVQKLGKIMKMEPATEADIVAIQSVPGYASPIGIDRSRVLVIADELVAKTNNLVVGANETDYHLINACHGRDFTADMVGDIVAAFDGALCPISEPDSGHTLHSVRGIEIGNIFQLGTKYTEALGAMFMDVSGRPQPIVMGSYGIGVGRLLACLCEEHHDENGLILPISVAPYQVHLVGLLEGEATELAAEQLYRDLQAAGIEVIFDDRHKKTASPGVKFSDADLIGIPIRVTVSKRSLKEGGVELKLRREEERSIVPLEEILDRVKTAIDSLQI